MNTWRRGLVALWMIATAVVGANCGDGEPGPTTPGTGSCGTRDCPAGYHCASEATGRCAPGCITNDDCASGAICDANTGLCSGNVVSETCADNVRNQGESGVDCGGPCAACPSGCDNEVMDGDETGVDCGGSCAACPDPCANNVRDGDETGVDCGGSCRPCEVRATCDDGIRNQTETDVDCGGMCAPCQLGQSCGVRGDCATNVCSGGVCAAVAASCSDGVKSGDETDVDCGGSCGPCGFGLACGGGDDCGSGVCKSGTCADPTCTDGVANGFESDVDCGPGCAPCGVGKRCGFDPDCASGACDEGRCVGCDDGVKNADETDIDCGGPLCGACEQGEACLVGGDCATGGCEGNICIGCGNGRRDGSETDVDCGGDCAACGLGKGCEASSDCVTAACVGGVCTSPSCSDGQLNSDETDVDCGGGCEPCARDERCAVDDDCTFGNYCDRGAQPRGFCESEGTLRLAAGFQFTCAWSPRRGQVACWGDNRYGQLGTGDTVDRSSPTVVPGLVDVVDLDAGSLHVCAVTRTGQVKCWGDGSWGKCGDGGGTAKLLVPFTVPNLAATKVGTGDDHTCVIDTSGGLRCWGSNNRYQLGIATQFGQLTPQYVLRGRTSSELSEIRSGATKLAAGADHTCATVGGNIYCWGSNAHEQFSPMGGGVNNTNPNQWAGLQNGNFANVAAGSRMTCFFDGDGANFPLTYITCEGWDDRLNQRFDARMWRNTKPVACGSYDCCGITESDGLACWNPEALSFVELPASFTFGSQTGLAVGGDFACVSHYQEGVYCWGQNTRGQLGLGRTDASGVEVEPTLVPGL